MFRVILSSTTASLANGGPARGAMVQTQGRETDLFDLNASRPCSIRRLSCDIMMMIFVVGGFVFVVAVVVAIAAVVMLLAVSCLERKYLSFSLGLQR
jgi:hypothetical protein